MKITKPVAFLIGLSFLFGMLGGMLGGKYVLSAWDPLMEGGTLVKEEFSYMEVSEYTRAVEKVSPAVVSIAVYEDTSFFGPGWEVLSNYEETAGGTGFVVTPSGLVMTNKHVVVEGADYRVIFNDGSEYEAEVVSRDLFDDIAVMRIIVDETLEPQSFPTVAFGDSDNLKVGQQVLAFGNALSEFGHTVTAGIISAKEREVVAYDEFGEQVGNLFGLLQTDAAINFGNSGGPLVNLKGEVVGMNTALVEGGSGLGFAIPVDDLKPVLRSIEENGEIVRPVLGVRFIMLNELQASEIDEELDGGALIIANEELGEIAIIPGGAAEAAGLLANDVIIEVDEEEVGAKNPLQKVIREYSPGDTVEIVVFRDGETMEFDVTLKSSKELE